MSANYTFSHSLDNLSSTFSDGTAGFYSLGYLDAFNPQLNYGNSDFDIRHRFNLGATWEVPWLKNADNKFVRAAFGGWGTGAILNIRSGAPFTVYDCSNSNDTTCPVYAPSQFVAHGGNSVPTGGNLFNYSAIPTTGSGDSLQIADLGNSLGMPNCTGLLHTGCTYTRMAPLTPIATSSLVRTIGTLT